MKIAELTKLVNLPSFHASADDNGNVNIAGMKLSKPQSDKFIRSIGWRVADKGTVDAINDTRRFVRTLNRSIGDNNVLNSYDISFETVRIYNTMKYFDRIKISKDGVRYVILHKMPRAGGRYAIYSNCNGYNTPLFVSTSITEVTDWLGEKAS